MDVGIVRQVDIDREMQEAYLSYAMSVIVARALPDARDGLKPVQRRILFAMYDMGLRPASPYKKSARIVGEVLGKYHPHGDAAVYDAMARMAQDFSLRYLLVDGQGNFGSIDGDEPAAMRYTEARIAPLAGDVLLDIEKDTVNFGPNFDDTLREPLVLPANVPNLLINGAAGIAVGMATSIPPHNLGEIVDALIYILDHWTKQDDITVEDLMEFVKGPDFPTGGMVFRKKGEEDMLLHAYGTGRSSVTVQARAHVEEMSRSRSRIIVTELPYQTNKSSLIERIAELVRDGRIEGITDVRDESDRRGMRIVIELTRTVEPDKVMADLYKHTPLRTTFTISLLALVDGEPRLLSLKKALQVFIEHRLEIVRRRSEYDLTRARERAHILEGLRIALAHLDEVISTIRRSANTDEARQRLMKRFKLTEIQANAILDMQLRRLAALERQKIEDEYKEKKALIRTLEKLLSSPKAMRDTIREELLDVRRRYADRRRTQVVDKESKGLFTTADILEHEDVWVTVTQSGALARTHANTQPKVTPAGDPLLAALPASSLDHVYLFAASGRAAAVPVHALPQSDDPLQGGHWADLCPLPREEQLNAALIVAPALTRKPEEGEDPAGYLFLATMGGVVKRVLLSDLPGPASEPFTVMNVAETDALGWVRMTQGEEDLVLVTARGQSIRFKQAEVRPMGLPAGGVAGIKLAGEDDGVIGADATREGGELLLVADNGFVKRTALKEFNVQGRNGVGVTAMRLTGGAVLVSAAVIDPAHDRVVLVNSRGTSKAFKGDAPKRGGRPAVGGRLLKLGDRERVAGVVIVAPAPAKPAPAPAKPAPIERAEPAKPSKNGKAPKASKAPKGKAKAGRKSK
jgi:DNA gyrase subunit A